MDIALLTNILRLASVRRTTLLAFLVCVPTFAAIADSEPVSTSPARENKADMMVLTVDKKTLQASLLAWPEDHQQALTLRQFKIAIGKEEGDKQYEGDNRTPEGIYFTQSVIDGATLPAKYGPRAIPINFPNPVDHYYRKTGHGIWLHGVEDNSRVEEANVTEGCVAFYNEEIRQLAYWLRPRQGIVVIADDISQANKPADLDAVRDATIDWVDAWARRDMDRYMSHYHPNFRDRAMDRDGYRDYKSRVFGSYNEMKLKISELRVITHPNYAVSIMNQDFNGDDRFVSKGRKILYWMKDPEDDGKWLILREVFENRRIELFEYNSDLLASLTKVDISMLHSDQSEELESTPVSTPNL